jgi:HK97 family phage major capsid protein/HK97 family phage prohead protease
MENKRDLEKTLVQRDFKLEVREVEKEDRTLEFPFSSEEPVTRYFGPEILEHKAENWDLKRLNDSAPLLYNHNFDRPIGVVQKAWIDETAKRGYAKVRFSKEEFASSIFRDIKDGIIRGISFGYVVKDMEQRGEEFWATSIEPYELSVAVVAADPTIGINRAATSTSNVEKASNMPKEERSSDVSASSDAPHPTPIKESMTTTPEKLEVVRSEAAVDHSKAIRAERSRIQEITTVASKYNLAELGERYIKEERSVADFNAAVLKEWKPEAITPKADETDIGLTPKETRSWSVLRAIDYLANPGSQAKREAAAFEIEASEAAAQKLGRASRGITIPNEVFRRDMQVSPDTAGGNLVSTELSSDFISLLTNASVLAQTGSKILTGLTGNISIPRIGSQQTSYWIGEGSNVTESDMTIEQVNMTPRTIGAMTDVSRKLLIQSSLDVESLVRQHLANSVALEIDRAALYGTGSSSEPLGVHNTTGIATENITNNDPTFAEVVAMESDISVANALTGNLAYVTRANIAGNMKVKAKDSGSGLFVWDNGTVNGYPAYISNQIEAGDVFFADWSSLIIGYWSGLDLQVDPYTGGASGNVRVRVLQDVDTAVAHPESFCLGA